MISLGFSEKMRFFMKNVILKRTFWNNQTKMQNLSFSGS